MILDRPDEVMPKVKLGDVNLVSEVGKQLETIVMHTPIKSYSATNMPGNEALKLIIFTMYGKDIGYFVKLVDNTYKYKIMENPEGVFTPNVLDLSNLTPISTEDALRRASI